MSAELVSVGRVEGWEVVETAYNFFGDCCWQVQMRKMG